MTRRRHLELPRRPQGRYRQFYELGVDGLFSIFAHCRRGARLEVTAKRTPRQASRQAAASRCAKSNGRPGPPRISSDRRSGVPAPDLAGYLLRLELAEARDRVLAQSMRWPSIGDHAACLRTTLPSMFTLTMHAPHIPVASTMIELRLATVGTPYGARPMRASWSGGPTATTSAMRRPRRAGWPRALAPRAGPVTKPSATPSSTRRRLV